MTTKISVQFQLYVYKYPCGFLKFYNFPNSFRLQSFRTMLPDNPMHHIFRQPQPFEVYISTLYLCPPERYANFCLQLLKWGVFYSSALLNKFQGTLNTQSREAIEISPAYMTVYLSLVGWGHRTKDPDDKCIFCFLDFSSTN